MHRITILGAGESGVGAALLGRAHGHDVFVSSAHGIASRYKAQLERHGICFEEGQHTETMVLRADEVVKSPGISDKVHIVQCIQRAGIPIIDEVVLAGRYTQAPVVGITGTNGKTTTTHLLYHTLQAAGIVAELAGNVGQSFAKAVLHTSPACWVIELSSFQLEYSQGLVPHIAIVLNITPDHLDRYESNFERYIAAKLTWLGRMHTSGHVIYVQDDPVLAAHLRPHCTPATLHPVRLAEMGCAERNLLTSCRLTGLHNAYNALAVIEAARLLGAEANGIARGLSSFVGRPHRMQQIAVIQGVTYYNDSKATNVDAVKAALQACSTPVVWIAGGVDKGNDYTSLLALVRQKVRALVCLGRHNASLLGFFRNHVDHACSVEDMQEAVRQAHFLAQSGDTVLLSPACASFDLFENFAERGSCFEAAVLELEKHLVYDNVKKGGSRLAGSSS